MRADQASQQNNFGTEKSPKTSETKAFSGQDPVRYKIIVVDNKCLQQVRNFKCLGCEISYENGRDIQQKTIIICSNTENSKQHFKPSLVQKFSTIKVYNVLALPNRLYGSEIWAIRKIDKKRMTTIEMKFFRRTAGYIPFYHKRNEEVL
jgi:hypothetical protein